MKSFEDIALTKLKEIEPASKKEWSIALGYKTPNAFHHTFMKLKKEKRIIQINKGRPAKYQSKEDKKIEIETDFDFEDQNVIEEWSSISEEALKKVYENEPDIYKKKQED